MKNQSEEELAKHFIDFFRDQDLYFEVPAGGIIDIVVKSGYVTTAIEVKTTFNFGVLEQAIKNCQYTNYSYIAVPASDKPYTRHFQEKLCRDYGVGLLVYQSPVHGRTEGITETVKPRLNRLVYRIKLHEYHKESVAGSQSNRMTAFKNYVRTLQQHIRRHPSGISLKKVFDEGFVHYASVSVFKRCLSDHIRTGLITGMKLHEGVIYPDKQQSA